jgi:hypothetical protein
MKLLKISQWKKGISTSNAINYALSEHFQLLEGDEEE